ncbi:uncharacterized protein [Clytia hemisphaerica]|uniref:uncharacterized protein n=1 Tax=Clytia hemisphaerica TaxID=252671 RepID=UPI0034D636DA
MKSSCSSSLCFNTFRSKDSNGNPIKFHRLPKDPELRKQYKKLFKTEGFNWKFGVICSEHWSKGFRSSSNDLPDVIVPESQYKLMKIKYERAKKRNKSSSGNNNKNLLCFQKIKDKLRTADSIILQSQQQSKKPKRTRGSRKNPNSKKENSKNKLQTSNFINIKGSESCEVLKQKINDGNAEINKLREQLKLEKSKAFDWEVSYLKVVGELADLESQTFTYEHIKVNQKMFQYYCGLSVEEFNLIRDCLAPYTHLLCHCTDRIVSPKLIDLDTQLLIVLTICRHALDLRFMAYYLRNSETTIQRIFNGWTILSATVFNRIDLRPGHKFLVTKMPEAFVTTGHGLTDLVIDATEFKFQCATNYEVNSLMFSHYKNTQTGKALVGIAAHGMGVVFSDIYPGSISDSDITEKTDILRFVEEEHELMSDRGFSVQDLCAIKGIYLNRPKQKENDQFSEQEIHRNFDIASTRIHVERFIGRVRDWTILNKVWPLNQNDILSSVWQMLCHIVNITLPPIGPKE